MAILDVRGFGLDINAPEQLLSGLGEGRKFQQLEREDKLRGIMQQIQQEPTEQQRQLAEQSAGLGADTAMPTREQLIAEARKIDPVMAEKQLQSIGLDSAGKRAEASRFAAQIQTLPLEQQNQAIKERIVTLQAQGRDPKDTMQLLDMDQSQRQQALLGVQLMDLSTKERLAHQYRLTKAQADKVSLDEAKSTKILDDGTAIIVTKAGKTRVVSPTGEEMKGGAAAAKVKESQEYGVTIQQRRAKGREVGKITAKAAERIYEAADKTHENIRNLESVITELDRGAKTGVINKYLPTFQESTLRLKNLKNRLGLDVVGSTTFGALSESELNMAMDTALPEGLSSPELKKWAQDRINAQRKVAQAMEEEANFISKPGNTRAMWREKVMGERRQAQQLSAQDQEALDWANANPNDPRAAQIKARLKR